MITAYSSHEGRLLAGAASDGADVVWLDLLSPERGEEVSMEQRLGINLPTREDMDEIEQSSRLYVEGGALFMTALILAQSETDSPVMVPVTFVLAGNQVITARYDTPRAIDMFIQRALRGTISCTNAEDVLLSIVDVVIDRLADVLERVGRDVEALSRRVFSRQPPKSGNEQGWRSVLEEIGRKGDLISNIRDSLGTLERLAVFYGQRLRDERDTKELRARLKDAESDLRGLADHSGFMSQKVSFLMEATLGLIGIEQNAIIKLLSVVSAVFLPPTLVASIYGMNFEVMPELGIAYGYPLALVAMLFSAVLPYLFFKRKGWL